MSERQISRSEVTIVLASLAILAFAGNSLLARAALANGTIEAGAFSAIRLAAGALILLPLLKRLPGNADVPGALALTIYMGAFSLAYLNITAATGALILFACVQATIIAASVIRGNAPGAKGWLGIVLAFAGLLYLLAPDSGEAKSGPALLMAVAGVGWGVYTLIGHDGGEPAGRTARSFLLATPMILPLFFLDSGWPQGQGVVLAIVAGAFTSGLGYVAWYAVAPRLGIATVASVQLATPLVAAMGGALLLAEPLTWRLGIAGAMILGGIMFTLDFGTRR